MRRQKKFKTVAGYLRSAEEHLWYEQSAAKREGRSGISDEDGQRQIINNLLPQVGIETLKIGEKCSEGIDRLRQASTDERQSKVLDDVLKWLRKPRLLGSSSRITCRVQVIGSTHEPGGVIHRGKHYTNAEYEALEAICRERGVDMDRAIEIAAGTAPNT